MILANGRSWKARGHERAGLEHVRNEQVRDFLAITIPIGTVLVLASSDVAARPVQDHGDEEDHVEILMNKDKNHKKSPLFSEKRAFL